MPHDLYHRGMYSNLPRLALLALLSILAIALASCGGDEDTEEESGDLGPDPVAMVPADAPFYTEIVVRPEGSLGEDLNSALSKLLSEEDPGARVREAIDQELADDPDSAGITYTDDIEPWLGSRMGVFVSGYDAETEEADAAAAIAITDAEAAQAFVDKAAEAGDETLTDETYEDVDYKTDGDDTAVGIDGDFLLIGNPAGFEAAVDAGAGDSLADNEEAAAALAEAPDNSLFSLYADTSAIVDLIKSSGDLDQTELDQIDQVVGQFGDGPIEAWGTVTDSSFAIGGSGPTGEGSSGPSELLSGFPADSWLAFASADLGEQLQTGIEQFESSFEAGFSSNLPPGVAAEINPFDQVEQETGVDLAKDLAWIGDVGGFVQGTSIFGLGGGLVLEATDEAAASDALGKLQTALEDSRELRGQVQIGPSSSGEGFTIQPTGGVPVGAEVVLQDGNVVAAIGANGVDDVLSPEETLEGSDRFTTASEALTDGATPTFFLDFAPIVALIEGSGQATADPDYQLAKPYIDALDYVISGSAVEGDRSTGSIVLGVKEAEASGEDVAAATITP